jgi:hypothetical protein
MAEAEKVQWPNNRDAYEIKDVIGNKIYAYYTQVAIFADFILL